MAAPFEKVFIPNRGEIALRILRACKEMGIATIVGHSSADTNSMATRLADESVCLGPPPPTQSYLNIPAILTAARLAGADAIHPGIGFLAENADFARIVKEHEIAFIGPEPEQIQALGDKITAKRIAHEAGLTTVPGSKDPLKSEAEAADLAKSMGYPVLIKATAGGGGRGMQIVNSPDDLERALAMAKQEAGAAFGNDSVYMEKFLGHPRHIEVQIIADKHGKIAHLGERECSIQRRHQKLIEEAPSPVLTPEDRKKLGEQTAKAVASLGYVGVGTVEFLYDQDTAYFIEMNTRLQVEHTVTEMITGIDLVAEQIRVAAGYPLSFDQSDVRFTGHAIECRINAEDPHTMMPSPGTIKNYHAPGGFGVRFDSHLYSSYTIPPYYDSLIGKLITHGHDRAQAIERMQRALAECVIDGIATNLEFYHTLLADEEFLSADFDVNWYAKKYMS
ncbi:MAG: acetyl-CoA carboxylase biotin carboxylase subunit [Pseudomonadota bacterium]